MDAEVRRIIGNAYDRTRRLLLDNKDKLDKVRIFYHMFFKVVYTYVGIT